MARKRERAFAAFGAALFLITSSALTIAVIVTSVQQHKQDQQLAVAAKTPCSLDPAQNKPNTPNPNQQMQGAQIANFKPGCKLTKLETIDTSVGAGEVVKAGDTVTVDYTGAVASTGTIFQSSLDSGQPASFPLVSAKDSTDGQGVIDGWAQGIPGMKVGGTRRLLIPASLAYGGSPPVGSGIPSGADLVFDVTVHKIGK